MKKTLVFFLLIVLLFIPAIAEAAIGFVGSSAGTQANATSITFSVDPTGADLLVVSAFKTGNSEDSLAATYNGVAMTEVNTGVGAASIGYIKMWYTIAPTAGAHNVVISKGAGTAMRGKASWYSGVSATGQPDTQTTGSGSGSPFTTNFTTSDTGSWGVLTGANDTGTPGASTGSTVRQADLFFGIFDSNAGLTAGANSMAIKDGGDNITIVAAFSPTATAGPTRRIIGPGISR